MTETSSSHKLLYRYHWLSVYQGFRSWPYVVGADGVVIIPILPEGDVILIQEPTAYGDGETALFLPGGGIEPGEDGLTAANRELQEETGFAAGRLDFLAQVCPWTKYMDASIGLYLARELAPSRLQGDEPYPPILEYISLAAFEPLIAAGRLTDSTVIAALFLARQRLASET